MAPGLPEAAMRLALRDARKPQPTPPAPVADDLRAAFTELYDRHFDGLFDFAARIVRDRDLAADVVQTTYAKAWESMRTGREMRHPKAWLYATARNRAIDELRARKRLAQEPSALAVPDASRLSDPQATVEDREMVDLVWDSAAALTPEEYSLLDMHVRRGLGAAELSEVLGVERGAVYTRLSRLRDSLEESVSSTLLVRRGSDDCRELAAIVAAAGGDQLTPELRREIRAHVKGCDLCRESRRRFAAPLELFGALAPIPALPGVREAIWHGVMPAAKAAGAAGAAGAAAAGAGSAGRKVAHAKLWAAGATMAAAAGAAIALSASGTTHVRDPARAASLDHAIGVASTDPTIAMSWSPGRAADGYSVTFSRTPAAEPRAAVNTRGTTFTSPPLAPGRWWFILRSHGRDGSWTDTLRRGPYVIVAAAQHRAVAARHRSTPGRRAKARVHAARAANAQAGTPAAAAVVPATPRQQPPAPHRAPAQGHHHSPPPSGNGGGLTNLHSPPRPPTPPPAVGPPAATPAAPAPSPPAAPNPPPGEKPGEGGGEGDGKGGNGGGEDGGGGGHGSLRH